MSSEFMAVAGGSVQWVTRLRTSVVQVLLVSCRQQIVNSILPLTPSTRQFAN